MKSRFLPSRLFLLTASALLFAFPVSLRAEKKWLGHDRTRPLPAVVDPGYASTQDKSGKAPSDAVVLFDGTDLSQWVALDGSPTKWVIKDGAMECVPGSGYIRTLRNFGDCQYHVEFATPTDSKGRGQGRGNSGVFFGFDRYEVQVLDSYENKTYADGSCASIYNQYPPLVNASRRPGEWQSYDIIWTAPRFNADGSLKSAARLTVFHNGVLVHNNDKLMGSTDWIERAPFKAHPEKLPLAFQDHGNPVRFRNVWVRELGEPGKPEFYLAGSLLDSYCGTYVEKPGEAPRDQAVFSRGKDGTLLLHFKGVEMTLFAESPTRFFGKEVDLQAEFNAAEKTVIISVGEDGGVKRTRLP